MDVSVEENPRDYVFHIRDTLAFIELSRDWLVEGLLPLRGFALLVAKPKVGKSTLIRELIRSVCMGVPFLGRETRKGSVFYLALEEDMPRVAAMFHAMDFDFELPVMMTLERKGCPHLEALEMYLKEDRPSLVVIDTLSRFVDVRDLNDYSDVTRHLAPVITLCRKYEVCVIATHHARKAESDESGDSALGSTAIFGTVDTLLRLRRDSDGKRKLESEQRYGQSMPPTYVEFDEATQRVHVGSTVGESSRRQIEERILEAIGDKELTIPELSKAVPVTNLYSTVNDLVVKGILIRSGEGKKGSPFSFKRAT